MFYNIFIDLFIADGVPVQTPEQLLETKTTTNEEVPSTNRYILIITLFAFMIQFFIFFFNCVDYIFTEKKRLSKL